MTSPLEETIEAADKHASRAAAYDSVPDKARLYATLALRQEVRALRLTLEDIGWLIQDLTR